MHITSMGVIAINRLASTLLAQTETSEAATDAATTTPATPVAGPGADRDFTDLAQDPQWWLEMFNLYGLPALKALILLVIALILAGWVKRVIYKVLTRARLDQTLAKFFASMARWGVLALAILAILSIFGIDVTSFAVVIGSIGLAIGLALQGSLGNFASGIMLLIFRPFKAGDVVQVNGITAKVDQIELFSTIVDTFDNRRIIIPNGAVFGNTIENISHHPKRRVDVTVGVEYAADIDKTRSVLETVAREFNVADLGDPAVVLTGLGSSSVDWAVRVWVASADYWPTREKMLRAVKMGLDAADIGIPFPQMDVHIDGAIQR